MLYDSEKNDNFMNNRAVNCFYDVYHNSAMEKKFKVRLKKNIKNHTNIRRLNCFSECIDRLHYRWFSGRFNQQPSKNHFKTTTWATSKLPVLTVGKRLSSNSLNRKTFLEYNLIAILEVYVIKSLTKKVKLKGTKIDKNQKFNKPLAKLCSEARLRLNLLG